MEKYKIKLIIFIIFSAVLIPVTAQVNYNESTLEESYLQESIEIMIIRETSRSDSRDQKLKALQYINNAINRGNTNDEICLALEYLSLEGTRRQVRLNNQLIVNNPDIRRQSATYLGKIGTEKAKDVLLQILSYDNEPIVLEEAVKSLGLIGMNNNNDVINAIVRVAARFDKINPDNLLAIAAIEAIDKLSQASGGTTYGAKQLLLQIQNNGAYYRSIREYARQTLANLQNTSR